MRMHSEFISFIFSMYFGGKYISLLSIFYIYMDILDHGINIRNCDRYSC